MEIYLHVGLHKTGTTFIQDSLRISKSELIDSGVYYIPLNDLRRNLTHKLDSRKLSNSEIAGLRGYIESEVHKAKELGCKRIILSDENILGFPEQITNEIYWTAKVRLQNLNSVLSQFSVKKIVITMREYSSFYQSLFLESNKHKYMPIEQVNKQFLMSFNYLDLITLVQMIFKDTSLEAFIFEQFISDHDDLFKSISGLDNMEGVVSYSKEKRVSPSAQAYLDSEVVNGASGLSSKTKDYLHNCLMNSTYHDKLDKNLLFDDLEIVQLKEKYSRNRQVLRDSYLLR